jgi:ubiquinone/menaquinone biosynthesis C-methylase UbiE
MNFGKPNINRAIVNYRDLALNYDASCERVVNIRSETVALLGLRSGDCVVDVACGTGLSFPQLRAGVGGYGRVVGVELSPEMCRVARERVERHKWHNIQVIEGDVLRTDLGSQRFDAFLFHYTHDVLRQPEALARLFAHAKPNARGAVAGMKKADARLAPLTWFAMWRARNYLTTFEGLKTPWSHLVMHWVPDFQWRSTLLGTRYIGWGHVAPELAPPPGAKAKHAESVTC